MDSAIQREAETGGNALDTFPFCRAMSAAVEWKNSTGTSSYFKGKLVAVEIGIHEHSSKPIIGFRMKDPESGSLHYVGFSVDRAGWNERDGNIILVPKDRDAGEYVFSLAGS